MFASPKLSTASLQIRFGEPVRLETQASVAKGATSLYVANVVVLVANTLYFLVLTNFLHSTLDVGIVTALNIMIWLLVTVCIFAQPITVQSPVPAPLAVLKFLPELIAKNARTGAAKLFRDIPNTSWGSSAEPWRWFSLSGRIS